MLRVRLKYPPRVCERVNMCAEARSSTHTCVRKHLHTGSERAAVGPDVADYPGLCFQNESPSAAPPINMGSSCFQKAPL